MTGAGIGSGFSGLGNSGNIHALLQRKDTDMTGSTGFSSIGRLFNYFTNESQILCFKMFNTVGGGKISLEFNFVSNVCGTSFFILNYFW